MTSPTFVFYLEQIFLHSLASGYQQILSKELVMGVVLCSTKKDHTHLIASLLLQVMVLTRNHWLMPFDLV
jgi:hypothetical protein